MRLFACSMCSTSIVPLAQFALPQLHRRMPGWVAFPATQRAPRPSLRTVLRAAYGEGVPPLDRVHVVLSWMITLQPYRVF